MNVFSVCICDARRRPSAKRYVQLSVAGSAGETRSSAANNSSSGGRSSRRVVSAICCNVFGEGPAVDSTGEVAARFVDSDVVLDSQRTVADGRDRLQRVVALVCGDEAG